MPPRKWWHSEIASGAIFGAKQCFLQPENRHPHGQAHISILISLVHYWFLTLNCLLEEQKVFRRVIAYSCYVVNINHK